MSNKGPWTEDYKKKFYESEKVQAHMEYFIEIAKQPKPLEQRKKMSEAKKNVPKSEAHRQRMSEAHKFRCALKKEILQEQPQLETDQVWLLVRERMYNEST